MSEHGRRNRAKMIQCCRARPLQCGQCPRTAHQGQLATESICAESKAQPCCGLEQLCGGIDSVECRPRGFNLFAQRALFPRPLFTEGCAIVIKGLTQADNVHACRHVSWRTHIHRQTEAILKLRSQLAFLGVAATDQDKAGGVPDAEPLTFNHIFARRGDIQ